MTYNFFCYDNQYYRQIRGGAMGSPLTPTVANAYMFFVEQPIIKWAKETNSIYYRYIDDLFIMTNQSEEELASLVIKWNQLDENIELKGTIGYTAEYLDVKLENRDGQLLVAVFHKPSHEPYFLPYSSTHAERIKRNIPYVALIRDIRYSSDYETYKDEQAHIIISLLLNKYPNAVIEKQFERVFQTFNCSEPNQKTYKKISKYFLDMYDKKIK